MEEPFSQTQVRCYLTGILTQSSRSLMSNWHGNVTVGNARPQNHLEHIIVKFAEGKHLAYSIPRKVNCICRCIPKMDHHCPWTANCVSHYTFPHFMRFLLYAVTSMTFLEVFLYRRGAVIWSNRDLRYVRLMAHVSSSANFRSRIWDLLSGRW